MLLAILFPWLAQRGASGAEAAPAAAATERPQAGAKEEKPPTRRYVAQEVLREFFGSTAWPGAATAPASGDTHVLGFLVATVPDPLQTDLGYMFDRMVASIQRAAEQAGFVLDRHRLPWRNGSPGGDHTAIHTDRDPGVLLFRGTRAKRLLIVYLVGEKPTSGVHPEALAAALEEISALCPGVALPPGNALRVADRAIASRVRAECGPLRVLGPTFSGSVSSLRRGLQAWFAERGLREPGTRTPTLEVRMISGSASSVDPNDLALGGRAHFSATVYPDEAALAALPRLLEPERSTQRFRIALLTESTGYGQSIKEWARSTTSPDSAPDEPARAEAASDFQGTDAGASAPGGANDRLGIVTLPFPLHVSAVRDAYERRSHDKASDARAGEKSKRLPLSRDDAQGQSDVLPAFSKLDVNSVEAGLRRIFEAIAREGIRHVGILATDLRDRLFLAEELREYCPNATAFTFDADALYGHSGRLTGLLVVSTYSLFTPNQRWSGTEEASRQRLVFPDSIAAGTFNAALAMLLDGAGPKSRLFDYAPPFEGESPAERRPPLWLSIVGRDGLVPVRFLDVGAVDANAVDAGDRHARRSRRAGEYLEPGPVGALPAPPASQVPPGGRRQGKSDRRGPRFNWSVPLVGPWLLIAATAAWLAFLYLRREQWLAADAQAQERRLYLIGACAALLIPCVVHAVSWNALLDVRRRSRYSWFWCTTEAAAWLTVAAVSILVLVLIARMAGATRRGAARPPRWALLVVGSLSVIPLAGAGRWIAETWRRPDVEGVYFFLRAWDLRNGVSLLLPLLLFALATFLWCFSALGRLRIRDELGATGPFLRLGGGSLAGVDEAEARVFERLDAHPLRLPGWPLLFLLVGAFGLLCRRSAPSVDGPAFDALARAYFVLVHVLVFVSLMRLLGAWGALRRLLKRLGQHPMVGAYSRLPKALSWTPMMGLEGRVPTFTDLEISIGYARRFVSKGQGDELGRLLAEALGADARRDPAATAAHKQALQAQLSALCGEVRQELEATWGRRGCAEPEAGEERGDAAAQALRACELFLASRVMALVRHLLAQLRNLLVFACAGLLLAMFATSAYPFQPRQLLDTFNWVAIVLAAGVILRVFVQMDRDRILSVMAGTTPGQLNWSRDLVSRVFGFVIVPLLSLFATQFPAASQLTQWVRTLSGAH